MQYMDILILQLKLFKMILITAINHHECCKVTPWQLPFVKIIGLNEF